MPDPIIKPSDLSDLVIALRSGLIPSDLVALFKQASTAEKSYTVDEFCEAERKSRSQLYEEWKLGIGPRYYLKGCQRIITHAARLDYQREREAAAATDNT